MVDSVVVPVALWERECGKIRLAPEALHVLIALGRAGAPSDVFAPSIPEIYLLPSKLLQSSSKRPQITHS